MYIYVFWNACLRNAHRATVLCHVIQLYMQVCMPTRGSHVLIFWNSKLIFNNSLPAMFSEEQLLCGSTSSQYHSLAFKNKSTLNIWCTCEFNTYGAKVYAQWAGVCMGLGFCMRALQGFAGGLCSRCGLFNSSLRSYYHQNQMMTS